MAELTRKERMKLPRQLMPAQDAVARAHNFDEVNLGFTTALAQLESERCLRCPRPKCIEGCPVGVRIDEFVELVSAGDFAAAAAVVKQDNALPAICGRVCPQEYQCEGACVLGRKHEPVAIGALERFVADYEREQGTSVAPSMQARTGKRVAVIGSGPSGLACAGDLARLGHEATVFEALHELGGVLVYGIPEFRLPKEIVRIEVAQLQRLGVTFETNAVIGMAETIDELLEGFDAVFVGVGAGLPRFTGVPGENVIGVYSANEFLTRVNLMKAYLPDAETPVLDLGGKRVAVFGGGNTALDAVRVAVRLGAEKAAIVYRRSEEEMPARAEEIAHAQEEGVHFVTLAAPLEFLGNDEGWLRSVRIQRMRLGVPDESGRRSPEAIEGSTYETPIDVAIIAIGNTPNPLLPRTDAELEQTNRGTLVADPDTGRTTKRGVFAGGDIVTGGATVILAMGAGRRAAASIHEYLATGEWNHDEASAEIAR
ncbi:MAG TPA: NADPH-dependent glutamate synthase [Acidimicrobiia bacterium]|jgi:glutamate synthase (NADPH/NADH) small chain|nr:NADPH-dependent glutamate synthase [Acidimicrobiia bacterium]